MKQSKSQYQPLNNKEIYQEGYIQGKMDTISVFVRMLGDEIVSQISPEMIEYYFKVCKREKKI